MTAIDYFNKEKDFVPIKSKSDLFLTKDNLLIIVHTKLETQKHRTWMGEDAGIDTTTHYHPVMFWIASGAQFMQHLPFLLKNGISTDEFSIIKIDNILNLKLVYG